MGKKTNYATITPGQRPVPPKTPLAPPSGARRPRTRCPSRRAVLRFHSARSQPPTTMHLDVPISQRPSQPVHDRYAQNTERTTTPTHTHKMSKRAGETRLATDKCTHGLCPPDGIEVKPSLRADAPSYARPPPPYRRAPGAPIGRNTEAHKIFGRCGPKPHDAPLTDLLVSLATSKNEVQEL